MSTVIDDFDGVYFFLSNFYPMSFNYKGLSIPSSEHLYQALKAVDVFDFFAIIGAPDAKASKKMGRKVKMRPDWDTIKDNVMMHILAWKFHPDAGMHFALKSTDDAKLVEGNWLGDTYWGVCKGEGQNKLGECLMRIRELLQNDDTAELDRIRAWRP
jgi:ribA/ribD-fused uncharacterized protein